MTNTTDSQAAVAAAPNAALFGWSVALLSTLAFSLAAPVAKAAIDLGLDPTVMLVLRYALTIALLWGTSTAWPGTRRKLDQRGRAIAFGSGLVHGVGTLTFNWALTRMDASISSMLFALYPLAVLGLLALRGERFTYRNTVRLVLGLGGVYLLIGPGGQADWLGIVLVAIAIMTSATQTVITQWFLRPYDQQATLLYIMLGMGALTGVYWLAGGVAPSAFALSLPVWGAVVVLAGVCTYLAWTTWFVAMRHVGTGPVAMLVPLETFLTVIWSVLFLSERLSLLQWLGGGLILLSTLLAVRRLGRVRLWPWRPTPPDV